MKIGFVSLGCPKNLVDTEVMMGNIASAGHSLTAAPEDADVIVVNTCSFIDPAKKESIDETLAAIGKKEDGTVREVYVMGCLVELYRKELSEEMPEIDGFFGTRELPEVLAAMQENGIVPLFLPTYASWLNPIEKWFSILVEDKTPEQLTEIVVKECVRRFKNKL